MTMRITGMYSGLDTESIIEELVKAKSTKVDNLTKEKTAYEWKQDAWKSLNTKIKSFYSSSVSSLRFSTAYKKKTTSVSNSSAVSVITGEDAMNSVQSLSIKRLAKSGYMTGATLQTADGTDATDSTKIADLRLTKGSDGTETSGIAEVDDEGSFSITVGDKVTKITVKADSTIDDIISDMKDAGIDANFDTNNQRVYIASEASGYDKDFAITADNAIGFATLSVLGINESLGTDTDTEKNANAKTLNTYTTLASYYNALKDLEVTTEQVDKTDDDNNVVKDSDGNAVKVTKYTVEGSADFLTSIGTDSDLYKAIKAEMQTDDDYDAAIARLKEKATTAVAITASDTTYTDAMYSSSAVRIAGQDAKIVLNEVEYTSNSNNFEINGLTLTCLSTADDISVTTQEDTDGIYDMIKSFFKSYNELINEMDKLYNADSADDYEPLTDDEKEEMSDSEIEEWETTIKDAILRRDDTLGTISSALKSIMLQGFTVNGTTTYLSNFGIETLSYFEAEDNEHNAYHIDGDSDDSAVATESDKLKTAIANDPDTVVDFFVQLSRTLYSKLSDLSASSDYSSAGSFYDDKLYKSNLSDYEDKIEDAEDALNAYEDKYYEKFSNMEVALSKLESSTSSITSLLG